MVKVTYQQSGHLADEKRGLIAHEIHNWRMEFYFWKNGLVCMV